MSSLYRKRDGVFHLFFSFGDHFPLGNWILIALILGKNFFFFLGFDTLFVIPSGRAIQMVLVPLIVKGVEKSVQGREASEKL